jgi:hypothetical protein
MLQRLTEVHALIDKNPNRRVFEALAFTGATLVVIWRAHGVWLVVASATLTLIALLLFWIHAETIQSLGVGWKELKSALIAWKWWFVVIFAVAVILVGRRSFSIHGLARTSTYLAWCCFQQFLYQNIAYKGVRAKWGPTTFSQVLAGLLFSSVHLPNPVLTPATLIWGILSSRLFERQPSILALGLLQMLLSALLNWSTPFAYHHGFRIGPHY